MVPTITPKAPEWPLFKFANLFVSFMQWRSWINAFHIFISQSSMGDTFGYSRPWREMLSSLTAIHIDSFGNDRAIPLR